MNASAAGSDQGYRVRVARTVPEIEEIRSVWESMQNFPLVDIDYFLEIILPREEVLSPHIMLLDFKGRTVAMMIGILMIDNAELKFGYKKVYQKKMRSLVMLPEGFLGERNKETATAFIHTLMAALKRAEADLVQLQRLPLESDIYRLAKTLPGFLVRDHLDKTWRHWSMNVPNSLDDFFNNIQGKNTFRKKIRRLEKDYPGEVQVKSFRKQDQVMRLCIDAEKIAHRTYHRGLGVGFIHDAEHERQMFLAAKRGWLRGYILYVKDQPCAFWILTAYKRKYLSDYTGFDAELSKYSPGMILFSKIIEELCQDPDLVEIDFGSGDGLYKQWFGDHSDLEGHVNIYPPTLNGVRFNLLRTAILGTSTYCESVLVRLNLRDKIKKVWRMRLAH
jgi:hypothetical protein